MSAIQAKTTFPENRSAQIIWSSVTEADTFLVSKIGIRYPDKTVSVEGTMGGATVSIQGSEDGVNFHTLRGGSGGAGSLVFTTAGQDVLIENVPYLKPIHTGGTGETVTVIITCASY
jgi:hypothetical protein